MMEKTLILKHISGMLCLLISYSKFTRTFSDYMLIKREESDIIKSECVRIPFNILDRI